MLLSKPPFKLPLLPLGARQTLSLTRVVETEMLLETNIMAAECTV